MAAGRPIQGPGGRILGRGKDDGHRESLYGESSGDENAWGMGVCQACTCEVSNRWYRQEGATGAPIHRQAAVTGPRLLAYKRRRKWLCTTGARNTSSTLLLLPPPIPPLWRCSYASSPPYVPSSQAEGGGGLLDDRSLSASSAAP